MNNEFDRRGKSKNKEKMRNLVQYKNMTDEEFEEKMAAKQLDIGLSERLEKRIDEKLKLFEDDYDLSDLKINDRETLRGLIQSVISLEDYQQYVYKVRSEGISPDNIVAIDRIQKIMSELVKSISEMQNDLNITRKHRKSDQTTSVIDFIDGLKEKARKFYESRMSYVFCPKCNTLLATVWTLYPNEERNKMALICNHTNDDGTLCGEKVVVSTKELLENRGTNKAEIMPESML